MEEIGKSYIVVIEPYNFNIRENKVFYEDFGFVISSQSSFFRDLMVKLCKKCHNLRKNHFGPKIITEIRENMENLGQKNIKTDYETLQLVATFFDITYYTATSHDKEAHLKTFSTVIGRGIHYYLYFGSRLYHTLEILEKIQEKSNINENRNHTGSYFEVLSIKN